MDYFNKFKKEAAQKKVLVIPLKEGVIFPGTEVLVSFDNKIYLEKIEKTISEESMAFFVLQKTESSHPEPSDIEKIGTLAKIDRIFRNDKMSNILVNGLIKAKATELEIRDQRIFYGEIKEEREKADEDNDKILALKKLLADELKRAVSLGKVVEFSLMMDIMSDLPPLQFAYKLASVLDIKAEEKQRVLEANSIEEKLFIINGFLAHEIKVLEIEKNISIKTQEKINKTTRDAVLRERLETIEKELGKEEGTPEFKEIENKILAAGMPSNVKERALSELSRLKRMPSFNPEASYIQTYLDWLSNIPWVRKSPGNVDVNKAEKILNEDHYGLEKIKERILEYLAVIKLRERSEKERGSESIAKWSNILCFVGPPGVGKTSIGKSIARALNRKFVSISLGGIRDEAEIKGHRRTYVGALPGRIIQGIRQADTRNPVFMMDEIDKMSSNFLGNPAAALLEVLDPEQNYRFSDNYLEVPYDLSQVFFITTCNNLDTIPPALRDRLEIIAFSGYTEDEKFHIAKDFLIKKELVTNGLSETNIEITDGAIEKIIQRYTKEAGVRNLEREIAKIFRKVAKEIVEGKVVEKITIYQDSLPEYLGPEKFREQTAEKTDLVGIASGLAWSEVGGVVLSIEAALMPGKGELILTGQLGDVMKESCKAALSYIRSKYDKLSVDKYFYQKTDIHIHVPEGAVQKDGPSAGVAITAALVSALTKTPIRREVGMTGEITLRGRILEVGGIREKVIAAERAGLKTIILPQGNRKDIDEIPKNILREINLVFAESIQDVINHSLSKPIMKD